MLHSFPNVRIGLRVGIGGGAPSTKHDFRLGDIVVSAPRGGKGGVFHYDCGKTIQNQTFQATGVLNQPPTALRTVVNGLRSGNENEGQRLEEAVIGVLERRPRLWKKYKRPDPGSEIEASSSTPRKPTLQNEKKAEDLLASNLKQLAYSVPESVTKLYEQHKGRRTRPLLNEISKTLRSVAETYTRVFVVTDALDECQAIDDCRNVFLSRLFDLQRQCTVKIFATARPIPEITERFIGNHLDIRAHESDLKQYLEGRILQAGSELLQSYEGEIKKKIVQVADGIQAYDDAKRRIEAQCLDASKLAMNVLMWITCAKRRLSIRELQEALAVEEGQSFLDQEDIPGYRFIVSVCAGLVAMDEENQVIRLIHHTTQEYLEREQFTWFPDADLRLNTVCVAYLSFDIFEERFCTTGEDYETRLK
ncbi:ankyrin [Penicillium sp. IBT 35674x]|nr:ankyrin [Penicillium sp. IBT 35674x]